MATAREESGYGAGGKFKKRPFRRQTTPYDRPRTALRNPPNINVNDNNNGWLSKLVDPAQRLIVSSAHRLFASVFRKRLPPPPPPPLEPEGKYEEKDLDQERVSANHPDVEGAISGHDDLNNNSDEGGLTELEQILKRKTFSRSEINRLTALLHSRTAVPVGDEQKSPEAMPLKPVVLHSRKEAALDTPVKENGIGSQVVSTPVVSSTVLDEDIASPAELAKAYMGSRPSKISPSMLTVRGQAFREESTVLNNQSLPTSSSVMSIVPRSSGHVGVSENGFVTPRTRGRSAIYNMARTPYSRVHTTSTFKGAGVSIDFVAGPSSSSSSQSMWERNRLTGSKLGTLKRRSSVLESDIGSVGPIRRIRQKPNLLSSKNLSLPGSGTPLSVQPSAVADAVQYPSSLQQMSLLSGEPKHGFTKMLTENGEKSAPSTSSTPVPSKSSEMASKILQQLDKLVSPREKSPTKLSPSMLHGPALKSLENVDSLIFPENVQDNNRLNGSLDTSVPDLRESTLQKRDKIDENGPTKFTSTSEKSIPAMNGVDTAGIKDSVPGSKTMDNGLTNSVTHSHPQKKRAFQMSAHEDYLDLDDDDYSNGPASMPLADRKDKPNASSDNKTTAAEVITVEKSPAISDVKPQSPVLNEISDKENDDRAVVTGKSPVFTFSTVPSPSVTAQPAEVATPSALASNKAATESSAAPTFSFGEKVTAPKESNAVSPIFSTSIANVDKVPQFMSAGSSSVVGESSPFKFGAPLNTKPESTASFASVAFGASDSVTKVPESDKADNKVAFKTPETSLPSAASTSLSNASIFSFGVPASSSTLNNGSLASSPSSTSSPTPPLFSSTGFNQNLFSSSTTSFATSNSGATSVTTTSDTMPSTAAPIFKFGSSAVPSTSSSPISATSGLESTEAKKSDTTFGNSTSMLFGASSALAGTGSSTSSSTSLANANTGSSIFGGTSPAFTTGSSIFATLSSATTSTGSSIFGGISSAITSTGSSTFGGTSTVANPGSSIFGFNAGASTSGTATSQAQASNPFSASSAQASVNATSVATTTQSMPTQFGSSSSASFGLEGNSTFSSSSSLFGSSTSAVKPFGSAPFGVSSSTSSLEANSISSTSGTTTSVFGSSWPTPKTSSLFGSTFNSTSPSTVFAFGASASSAASSSTPMFGSSTNGSSSSIFPFSSAVATSSQPAFGNANSVFAFGSSPSNNNDQMSMEDSMAEDTVPSSTPTVPASTPAIPAFGQQPVSPPSSFVFGAAAPSGANPFQFGSQQNMATPPNPSPFQASGSLDFNAGGSSFSLGTGGGDKSQRKIVKVNRKPRKK